MASWDERRSWGVLSSKVPPDPRDLTNEEAVFRGLALGGIFSAILAPVLYFSGPVPAPVLVIALPYAWLQGGFGWWWYRRLRKARGVSPRLLRPRR